MQHLVIEKEGKRPNFDTSPTTESFDSISFAMIFVYHTYSKALMVMLFGAVGDLVWRFGG